MKKISGLVILLFAVSLFWAKCNDKVTENDVLAVMKKASEYMANTVSCRGGYLWSYAADFSEYFGEVTGRASQIITYGSGTDGGSRNEYPAPVLKGLNKYREVRVA